MKSALISILCLFYFNVALAQLNFIGESAAPESAVNIATDEVNQVFFAPEVQSLKSAEKLCVMNITYINFPEEAKKAFEYAISIWEEKISSPIVINVKAVWGSMPEGQLGSCAPSNCYRNFKGTPLAGVFYPVALAEKVMGKEFNKPTDSDIECTFNGSKPWYFGTDGKTPGTQYDFVTSVLHEIGHGLGFVGYFKSVDGIGQFSNASNAPSVYDYYIFNKNNQRIADNSIFPSPSGELTQQLTSSALNIYFDTQNYETKSATVYAPKTWSTGVSIYHLTSEGNQPEIMKAFAYKGEANHTISDNTIQILAELGWEKSGEINTGIQTANNEEAFGEEDIKVYPNPFAESLTFECSISSQSVPVEIRIADLMGRIIYQESNLDFAYNPTQKIDLSSIGSGIYLASIVDSNHKTISKRIIKQ